MVISVRGRGPGFRHAEPSAVAKAMVDQSAGGRGLTEGSV